MRKKLIKTLCLFLVVAATTPISASASEITSLSKEKNNPDIMSLGAVSSFFIGYLAGHVLDGIIVGEKELMDWARRDSSGYSAWVKKVNEGRHCQNMCPKHNKFIDPREYGF